MERTIDARLASTIIFEALSIDRASDVPADLTALKRFVEGPLRTAIARRLGATSMTTLVEAIETELLAPPDESDPERHATVEVPVGAGPVVVLVVSPSASLAVALRAALGGDRLGVRTASDAPTVESALAKIQPDLLIIDATEPCHDMPAMAGAILRAGGNTACLLWGRETPWGLRFGLELDRRGQRYTPVDRTDGVEPLLDLIRSRLG